MRKCFKDLYRGADRAYSSMDYTGIGYITERDFMGSIGCTKSSFNRDEI